MKRGKSRRKPLTGQSRNKLAPVADRRLIPVDDGPVRKRATTELNRAMAKLDSARAEWRRYEEEDRPSFSQWMAETFGVLLTDIRENARLISEREALIEAVELEMMWGNHHNPRKAYAAVMKRRESPDDDSAEADTARQSEAPHDDHDEREAPDDSEPFEERLDDVPEEEHRAMFDDFLKSVLGINPKHIGRAEYAKLFTQFEADVFGNSGQSDGDELRHGAKSLAGRDEARIKEIYRTLARRLHPDLQEDGDAQVSAVWHEVQEAYGTRNLGRLETLLALTEIRSGASGGEASLSQLQGALEELNRGLKAVQRSIREAKHDPAWRFSQTENRAPLQKRLRRELEQSIAEQRWVLADLKRTLDDWSRPWHPPAKKPKKQPQPPQMPGAERRQREPSGPKLVQTELFEF